MAVNSVAAPFNGSWLQGAVEGDVTDWLKLQGVGWKERQFLWVAGYGKGRLILSLLIDEGRLYNLEDLADGFSKFRYSFALDGERHPYLCAELAPFVPLRNHSISGQMGDDGVLEVSVFNEKGDLHCKSRRWVSPDGLELKTEATFFGSAKEVKLNTVHTRMDESVLSLEHCRSWCPNIFVEPIEAGQARLCAVSAPLDTAFSSAKSLADLLEKGGRTPQPPQDGDEASVTETSDAEWAINVKKATGVVETFTFKVDREACEQSVTFVSGDKEVGTWHFKVLSEPLRLKAICTMDNDYVAVVSSVSELQKTLDKALQDA